MSIDVSPNRLPIYSRVKRLIYKQQYFSALYLFKSKAKRLRFLYVAKLLEMILLYYKTEKVQNQQSFSDEFRTLEWGRIGRELEEVAIFE